MYLYGHPELKFRTRDKLHIANEPGLLCWFAFIFISSTGMILDYYYIPDYFIMHFGFLVSCLAIGLKCLKTWEDFILDREENVATLLYRKWYHGLSSRVPDENVKRFPLNSITSVVINSNSGIDVIKSDGTFITIVSDSRCDSCIRNLRKEISTFLYLERIEYLETKDKMFEWENAWSIERSDSDDESHDSDFRHLEDDISVENITGISLSSS